MATVGLAPVLYGLEVRSPLWPREDRCSWGVRGGSPGAESLALLVLPLFRIELEPAADRRRSDPGMLER